MSSEYLGITITTVLGVIAFFIGIILVRRKRNTGSLISFVISGAFILVAFVRLAYIEPRFSAVIGSLAAVGASFLAGVTIIENKRLRVENRKDDLGREERERKERLLNEIKDWANNLNSKILMFNLEPLKRDSDFSTEMYLKPHIYLNSEVANTKYIQVVAKELSNNLEEKIDILSLLIPELSKLLVELRVWHEQINFPIGQVEDKAFLEYNTRDKKYWELKPQIVSSINDVLQEVAKAKLALLTEKS